MAGVCDLSKRILIVLSEFGYWGEELVGPLETFDEAGYQVDFATPKGKRPTPLPPSMDPQYIDPPLGKSVTSQEVADKVKALDASSPLRQADRHLGLDPGAAVLQLADAPARPWRPTTPSSTRSRRSSAKYDAILLVGGSGPIVDIANNDRVHALILLFQKLNKPIGAECYGVAASPSPATSSDRKSIISGKHVTGHCKEYDYKDGTGFIGVDVQHGPAAVPARVHPARRHRRPTASTIGNVGHATSVIVDYPFITGRSTPDSYLTGREDGRGARERPDAVWLVVAIESVGRAGL